MKFDTAKCRGAFESLRFYFLLPKMDAAKNGGFHFWKRLGFLKFTRELVHNASE